MECTLITSIMALRAPTDPWNGVPARDLSTFRRSSSAPCQAVCNAFFVDEFCEGPFAGRVVESGIANVTRFESLGRRNCMRGVVIGRRVACLLSDAGSMVMVSVLPMPVAMLVAEAEGSSGRGESTPNEAVCSFRMCSRLTYVQNGI